MQVECHRCASSDEHHPAERERLSEVVVQGLLHTAHHAQTLAQEVFCPPINEMLWPWPWPPPPQDAPAHEAQWRPPGQGNAVKLSTSEVTKELAKRMPQPQFQVADRHMLLARLTVQGQQAVRTLASRLSDLAWRPDAGIAQPILCDFTNVKAVQILRGANAQLMLVPRAQPHSTQLSPAQLLANTQLQCALARLRHLDLRNNALGTSTSADGAGNAASSTAALANQLRRHARSLTFLCLSGNPLIGDRLVFSAGSLPVLQHLNMSGCCGFKREGVMSVRHLTALTHLDLAHVDLHARAAQLAHGAEVPLALAELQHLQHLDVSYATCTNADFAVIGAAASRAATEHVQLWPMLTSLRWQSDNDQHDQCATAVLALLQAQAWPMLAHLDLSGTIQPFDEPPPHALNVLPGALAHLTYLDLHGRCIGVQRLHAVLQAHGQTLRQANLSIEDVSIACLNTLRLQVHRVCTCALQTSAQPKS